MLAGVSPGAASPTELSAEARGVLWGQGFPCSKIAFLCPARTSQLPGNPRSRASSLTVCDQIQTENLFDPILPKGIKEKLSNLLLSL